MPKRGCGRRNQCGRMPSSETRFNTPFDPTIAVFTAPASISVPTMATKARKPAGPRAAGEVHRESADGVVEEIACGPSRE